jgi:hypothetical protein
MWLKKHPHAGLIQWLNRRLKTNPYWIFILVIPLYIYESLLEPFFPTTHNLVWDWFNFINSMTLFFYGFVLITIKEDFFRAIHQIRYVTLGMGLLCFTLLILRWTLLEDNTWVHFTEALIKTTNLWAWILTIFAFAAIRLNHNSPNLAYANRAVYPFYILHQTITLIIGLFIYQLPWNFVTKASILTLGTFGGCFLLYEFLIRRIKWLHPVFGLKRAPKFYSKR